MSGSVNYMIYAMLAMFGLYLLVITKQMKRTGKIHEIILPKEELFKIKNVNAYINYTRPAMYLFSADSILISILGILKETGLLTKVIKIPDLVLRMIMLTVFLAGFGFFYHRMRKAKEQF
mgnify:CR=1 FL=1